MIAGADVVRGGAALVAVASLADLAYRRHRAAHYPPHFSAAISGCCVLPPAWFSVASPPAAVLALSTYAIGASATALADSRDPRRIIQLGGALAAGQILAPLSGTIIALLLPFTLRIPQPRHTFLQATGLYLLILFIPAMTALTLMVLWRQTAPSSAALFAATGSSVPGSFYELICGLVLGALPVVPAIAYSAWRRDSGGRAIVSSVFATLICSYALAGWLGEARQARIVIAGLMPLAVLALSELPGNTERPRAPELAAAFILPVSCGLALLAERFSGA
jgi:hypothetical protein